MPIRLRPARTDTDLPGIVQICNTCDPDHPVSVERVRAWFADTSPRRIQHRLVTVDAQEAVTGYGLVVHAAEMPARHFYTWVGVDPACRGQGLGSALWEASLRLAQAAGAERLSSDVLDSDPVGLAFAQRRGFAIDRHSFRSTLDLAAFDETPFLPLIAGLAAQGIRFCTLAELPDTPETRRQYYELNLATVRDIPGEVWDFAGYPQFFQEQIIGAPWFRPEGQILALNGDAQVGFASVSLQEKKHSAYNATTGVLRAYRGRHIALALKVLAARYARQHGAQQINTDNDSLNTPMLAVNQRLGYQPQSGKYLLERRL